jgi:hypothetical protein
MTKLLHDWVLPGICITIFSMLAIVLTIFPLPTDKSPKAKFLRAIAIVVAAILCVSEIAIIRKDRDNALEQHKHDMDQIANFFKKDQSLILGLQRNQTIIQHVTPRTDPLKRTVLDLSSQILQFLLNREVVPGFGQGPYGEVPFGGKPTDAEAYDKETIDIYLKAYEPQVRTTYEVLKARGLTDPQLAQEYGNPVNTYSIKDTAERLTALASRLPD